MFFFFAFMSGLGDDDRGDRGGGGICAVSLAFKFFVPSHMKK